MLVSTPECIIDANGACNGQTSKILSGGSYYQPTSKIVTFKAAAVLEVSGQKIGK